MIDRRAESSSTSRMRGRLRVTSSSMPAVAEGLLKAIEDGTSSSARLQRRSAWSWDEPENVPGPITRRAPRCLFEHHVPSRPPIPTTRAPDPAGAGCAASPSPQLPPLCCSAEPQLQRPPTPVAMNRVGRRRRPVLRLSVLRLPVLCLLLPHLTLLRPRVRPRWGPTDHQRRSAGGRDLGCTPRIWMATSPRSVPAAF